MPKTANPADDRLKRAAAERAVDEVCDGMVVGLGTGSTAAFAVAALARRIAGGLRIIGIPTSERTAALARELGVPLTDFSTHNRIDLTIDGADQVERGTLNIIKGGGGALLREKIVASASRRLLIIIDENKLVDQLGEPMPLPVEVVPFGHEAVIPRLIALGLQPRLRRVGDQPFVTDGGHYILDCAAGRIADAAKLQRDLRRIVGVVDSGLFVDLASTVMVGRPGGVEILNGEARGS